MGIFAILKLFVALTPYLPLLVKFWASFESLFRLLKNAPDERREEILKKIHAASVLAEETEGNTSGYEAIIKKGHR